MVTLLPAPHDGRWWWTVVTVSPPTRETWPAVRLIGVAIRLWPWRRMLIVRWGSPGGVVR